jgi:GntR family transcriptional regulator
MDIHLSQNDGVPVYLQIINQVKYLISAKRFATHQEIPPIRVLAEELLINPNTVARAYRELETAGWVYKKRGAGTFVSDAISPLSEKEKRKLIDGKIMSLLTEAAQIDISLEQIIERIEYLATKQGSSQKK